MHRTRGFAAVLPDGPPLSVAMHWVPFGPCAGPMGPYGADNCAGRGTPVLDCLAASPTEQIMICRPCQDRRVDLYVAQLLAFAPRDMP